MTETIRVGLVDDQQLVRAGFAMVLDSQDDIEVLWQAGDGIAACELARDEPVDVLLMDVQMPRRDGISATRQVVDSGVMGPSGEKTRVVMLTTFEDDDYVRGAVEAGASGFLLKDVDPEYLIHSVRTVGDSSAVVSPAITARLLSRIRDKAPASTGGSDSLDAGGCAELLEELPEPLTPRELEILQLIARGLTNQEIADDLVISLPTVKTHIGRVLAKTGSRDRVQAVLFAFRSGVVDMGELLQG